MVCRAYSPFCFYMSLQEIGFTPYPLVYRLYKAFFRPKGGFFCDEGAFFYFA